MEAHPEEVIATQCIPEGTPYSYECSVEDMSGIGSTHWLGESFKCMESSNRIRLTHSLYYFGEHAACGNFSAVSISITNRSVYTSKLSFIGDSNLNGTTINCTLSGVILVSKIVVKVAGELCLSLLVDLHSYSCIYTQCSHTPSSWTTSNHYY